MVLVADENTWMNEEKNKEKRNRRQYDRFGTICASNYDCAIDNRNWRTHRLKYVRAKIQFLVNVLEIFHPSLGHSITAIKHWKQEMKIDVKTILQAYKLHQLHQQLWLKQIKWEENMRSIETSHRKMQADAHTHIKTCLHFKFDEFIEVNANAFIYYYILRANWFLSILCFIFIFPLVIIIYLLNENWTWMIRFFCFRFFQYVHNRIIDARCFIWSYSNDEYEQ